MYRRKVTLSILRGEVGGAVLVVVRDGPAAGACLHAGLIAIGIKLRQEETLIILHNAGVLVELIGSVLPQKKQSPKSGCLKIAVTETLANN